MHIILRQILQETSITKIINKILDYKKVFDSFCDYACFNDAKLNDVGPGYSKASFTLSKGSSME